MAFVASTVNQVVKKHSLRGADLLLQTRTKVFDNELEDAFRKWYPQFRPQAE